MIQVIPSLLSQSEAEFRQKTEQVKAVVDMVHVDVDDGKFESYTCWADPEKVGEILSALSLSFGVHLMVENPEQEIARWAEAGAERLIVHIEATKDPVAIINKIHSLGCEAGLSLDPETPVERIMPFLNKIDLALVMAVHPGAGGQEFEASILPKIKKLRDARLDLSIGVDGGINLETAKLAVTQGADTLIAGHYLFAAQDLAKALNILRAI